MKTGTIEIIFFHKQNVLFPLLTCLFGKFSQTCTLENIYLLGRSVEGIKNVDQIDRYLKKATN